MPIAPNALAMLALGWSYSGPPLRLKRWPAGLAVVAVLAGLLTYHAGYAANGGREYPPALLLFTVIMSLWMGLVSQTKDLSGVEGDRHAGRRSWPIVWGGRTARRVLAAVALGLGSVFVVTAALVAPGLHEAEIVVLAGAAGVAALALSPLSEGTRSAGRRPYNAFMLTQYGAHLTTLAIR